MCSVCLTGSPLSQPCLLPLPSPTPPLLTAPQAIRRAYRRLYDRELEKDIVGDTSGPFQHILVSLVQVRGVDEMTGGDILVYTPTYITPPPLMSGWTR